VDDAPPKKVRILGLVAAVVLGILFVSTVGYFRLYRKTALNLFLNSLSEKATPLEQALIFRHVDAGKPQSEMEAEFPPVNKRDLGRFTVLNYKDSMEGTVVVALNGKLVSATAYTGSLPHVYFNALTVSEQKEFDAERKDFWMLMEQKRLERRAKRKALAPGPAATSTNLAPSAAH
jgi:hypothetical protein